MGRCSSRSHGGTSGGDPHGQRQPLWIGRLCVDPRHRHRFTDAHAIKSGWIQVNQGLGQMPGHSYGGYKQSGMGREGSLEGMLDAFTQRQSITVNLNTPRGQGLTLQ